MAKASGKDGVVAADIDGDAEYGGHRPRNLEDGPLSRKGGANPVRQHFRVPADPEAVPRVLIKNVAYRVYDVSEGGICHLVSKVNAFTLGEDPGPITVTVAGRDMELSGAVVHLTPHGEDRVRCGIRFTALNPEQLRIIQQYVAEVRSVLFTD